MTAILQYVIYERPRDFPTAYVVREWSITKAGPKAGRTLTTTALTLEEARTFVPADATRVQGRDTDEPQIIEVWM